MNECRKIENVNLSGIEFHKEGDSVELHLVEMVPPYGNWRFQCCNVYSLIMHRPPGDQIPYYVGELVWRELTEEQRQAELRNARYPIFDGEDAYLALNETIISVHLEGSICCDILAEKVMLESLPNSGKPYRRRVDASGNPLGPDDSGEFISPLPGH